MTDWTALLATFINGRLNIPFTWGEHDCALFLADWILARTGHDYAAPFRGRYKTAIGSKRALKRLGYNSLEQVITSALGEPLTTPLLGQRGDAVLVDTDEGPAAGVVFAAGIAVQGETGIVSLPLGRAICAWRIS